MFRNIWRDACHFHLLGSFSFLGEFFHVQCLWLLFLLDARVLFQRSDLYILFMFIQVYFWVGPLYWLLSGILNRVYFSLFMLFICSFRDRKLESSFPFAHVAPIVDSEAFRFLSYDFHVFFALSSLVPCYWSLLEDSQSHWNACLWRHLLFWLLITFC